MFDFDYWECQCGYTISEAEMKKFRLDFGCPRCGLSFTRFSFIKAVKQGENNVKTD